MPCSGAEIDTTAIFNRWGLAAGYVKQRLYEANRESPDIAARTAAGLLGHEGSVEMIGDDSQLQMFLSTNVDKIADFDCAAHVRSEGARALAAMGGEERELFDFYLALDALGATGDSAISFFRDASLLAAWSFLAQKLDDAAASHGALSVEYSEIGAGLWISGILLNVIPGAGVPFLASALVMFGLAEAEQVTADGYTQVASDARTRLQGEGSFGAEVTASGSALARDVHAGSALLGELLSAQAQLAELTGPDGENGPSESERLAALVAESDQDRLLAEQGMQSAMTLAREAQDCAVTDYRRVLDSLVSGEGSTDIAALVEAAQRAFGSASFVEVDHAKWLAGMQHDLALLPDPTSNTPFEAARLEVLQGLGQSLVSMYQGRLAALAEVRLAEWTLKLEEVSRAQAAWNARMDLLVSRARSAWSAGSKTLLQEQEKWRTSFAAEYTRKTDQWEEILLGFQERKRGWVEETALRAARVGSEQILDEVGQSADALSREATGRLVTGMSGEVPGAEDLLARLMPSGSLAEALAHARQLADSAPPPGSP